MFKRIFALVKKELLMIWRDPKSRMLVLLPPVLQLFIFAQAMTMEVKNIDMAVLDKANTVESRELVSRFSNSKWFKSLTYMQNEKELARAVENQKVQMALEIGEDFSKQIKRGSRTSVQVITDGRQTNTAGILGGYANQIISQFSNEYDPLDKKIEMQIRSWYNPNLEYLWYTLVSLMTLLAMVITLLLTSLSVARERELGTFDQLIVSPLMPYEILAAKTIAPMIIAITLSGLITLIAIFYFKVPFIGSYFLYFISTIIAILSITGVGLFISSLCKTQQQAILGAFTFQMPASLLSGFISPIEDMPLVLQYLTCLNPLRFYMKIGKGIVLKNMATGEVFLNLIPLILIAAITLFAAGWIFKRKLD